MKFAHLADCHIGGFREEKMREVSTRAFHAAIDYCLIDQVDFILISGDLFNTALPSIDSLKSVSGKLKEVKDKDIPVYIIAGSHDFSPSGKTMLDVFENAGLVINVCRGEIVEDKLKLHFTIDKKTGVKITGMIGKKNMLEKSYYENLIHENLVDEPGYKIFMFHSAIEEFKTEEYSNMDAHPLSLIPKGFDYYAGGHLHYIKKFSSEGYKKIAYPGALFPNNFSELEKYGHGGFYIVTESSFEWIPIKIKDHARFLFNAEHKTPEQLLKLITEEIKKVDVNNKIVTIRITGTLESGRISDINLKEIYNLCENAYFVLRNTAGLKTKEFEEVIIEKKDIDNIENDLIKEHIGKIKFQNRTVEEEEALANKLMFLLNTEKKDSDGEKTPDYEERVYSEIKKIINI